MNIQRMLLLVIAIIALATTVTPNVAAQPGASARPFQQMTEAERAAFVAEQSRRIARQMSGREYEFTPEFEAEISKAVEAYARRINTGAGDQLGKGDARFVFERGQTFAPVLIRAFRKRNVSPLIGLYIPLVESEYVNIESPNQMGAMGMYQFLPQTGRRFGLTPQELLDVEKSADAAARYIASNIKRFQGDAMKEALALLSYNRGEGKVERDVAHLVNEQNKQCSICALTNQRYTLDKTFQTENAYYVPRFFAAAVIGENPQSFGLQLQPLSSYDAK